MTNTFCADHINDFRHLTLDLGGLEQDYDLGFKFKKEESEESRVDPNTRFISRGTGTPDAVRAWAEPLLVLYVSVVRRDLSKSVPTPRYGLTRSKFSLGAITPRPDDKEQLLRMADPASGRTWKP